MKLRRIDLQGYRNYEELTLETDAGVIIFVGPNAQGKTNLLEAIYVLALTKSHRTSKDKELIGWEREGAYLRADIERKYGTCKLELSIHNQGKKAKVNGLEQRKLSGYLGMLNVVMFAPEDLEIVKGSPGVRRRFLDMEIAQIEPSYIHYLQQYQKTLTQRNHLLKDLYPNKNASLLDVWDQQLAEFGSKIIKKRQQFIYKLQSWAERIHSGITNGTERLSIDYQPSFPLEGEEQEETILFNQFMIKLTQVREQELKRGMTLVGPHRDDLLFSINGKEAQTFGSQGQQRTTALSLKLAEIELIHQEVGEYPILLLDDVLSELDRNRQTQLIETFQSKVQTFITTTGVESVDLNKLHDAAIFQVVEGTVTQA